MTGQSRHATWIVRLAVLVLLTQCTNAQAGADDEESSNLQFSGDARILFNGIEDGSDEASLRIRAGMTWDMNPGLSTVVRAATSASTSGNDWSVGAFPDAQTTSGLAPGNVTLDLAHFQFETDSGLRLRVGRFQESLALPAVPDKSLDRKDSDSTGISYSDGISLEVPVSRGWSFLGIAQYQPDGGATNRPREPLSFDGDGNPVSGFFVLRRADDSGPWSLSSLSYSVFPDSLIENGRRQTYSGLTGNLMRRIPVDGWGQLLIGGSLAYAPEIPQAPGTSGESHRAWQLTANLVDFAPLEQAFGVVYMRTGTGWLLSPDLANGRWLAEARYRFVPVRGLTCEIRLRYRGEVEDAVSGTTSASDRDWYLRLTWRS